MKLTHLMLLATLSMAAAAPLESCTTQKDCLIFTYKPITSGFKCAGSTSGNEYEVCMKLNLNNPGCVKSASDTVSHSCVKDSSTCSSGSTVGFKGAKETPSIKTGYEQCQIAKAGDTIQFLMKDGKGCGNSATLSGSGLNGSCGPRSSAVSSCTGNKDGMECIWTIKLPPVSVLPAPAPVTVSAPVKVVVNTPVTAPVSLPAPAALPTSIKSNPTEGGAGGDPHFRTYDGTMYSYHGQCDLVMARSTTFGNGLGIDVHARTKIVTSWSLISNAAIRIGNDIFEVANNGAYYYHDQLIQNFHY